MYQKDNFEIMDTNLTELAEELAFEDDMASDPYDDSEWEDRYDECGFDPYEGCYTYDC